MATAQLLPNVFQTWTDSNGVLLNGGKIYSYAAGTTTLQATYTDETAVTANTNPVILNSSGAAQIWLRWDLSYKLVLQDSSGNTISTVDNVNIVNPASIDKTKIAANIAGAGLAQNGGTSAIDVQVDGTTVQVNGSNQLAIKTGGITIASLPTSSKLEVVVQNVRDQTCPGLIQMVPQFEWTTPTNVIPTSNPAGQSFGIKWSPNDEFLAVAHTNTPYITIYQRSVTTFTKLANPGTLPTGNGKAIAWSPCGDFLAIGHATSPFVTIYQRSGNGFTKLSDPGTLPSDVPTGLSFSPNSDFLGVIGAGNLILYKRSGTTFTDITVASGITNAGTTSTVAWSPDSSLIALLKSTDSSIQVWSRANATFTAITPPSVSSYLTHVKDFRFSPDGNFFSVALDITPFVLNFSITGTGATATFSAALSNPATLPAGAGQCVAWSLNSEYLAVGHATTPFVTIYSVSGTTFTKLSDLGFLPFDTVVGSHWAPKKQWFAVCTGSVPYIHIYETASTLQTNALIWTRAVNNV